MTITITAFERSPDGGKGLARDMRVRWALEEAGLSYDVRLLSFKAMREPAHLALQPFGQIPTYEEGDLVLFESGAIIFHIAERNAGLLPRDVNARARAITWMFAALNTVEPPIVDRSIARFLEGDKSWYEERLAIIDKNISKRLGGEAYKRLAAIMDQALAEQASTGAVDLHRGWIEALLKQYYDPMYAYQRESKASRIEYSGEQDAVVEFLRERASTR